jgi:hypothetical protein
MAASAEIEFVSLRYSLFYGPGTPYREGDLDEQPRQQQVPVIGNDEGCVGLRAHQ